MRQALYAVVSLCAFGFLFLSETGCRRQKLESGQFKQPGNGQVNPVSSSATANTSSNYIATIALPFYTRFWVTPFLSTTEARRPWAKDAIRLLEEDAFGSAAGWVVGLADIRAETPNLIEKGCTYPVIRWMFAMHLINEGKTKEALEVLNEMVSEMENSRSAWPSVWQALVRTGIRNQVAYTPPIEAAAATAFYATLADGSFKPNEIRAAWDFLCACKMDTSTGLVNVLLSAKARNIDPWFVLMLQGKQNYNRAWSARGTGYACSVSTDGWQKFGTHITQSQQYFEQAWNLHPEIPTTACELIDSSRGHEDACRRWFDRAIKAEIDYGEAYRAYSFTLRPRWGGSLARMEELADEAYGTGRFDTDAPIQCVFCYFEIADELRENWQSIFQKTGVYEKCKTSLERHSEQTFDNNRVRRSYLNTALAYAAYGAGDFDTAGLALGRQGQPLTGHMAYDGARPPPPFNYLALSAIKGLNGPNKTTMRKIHQMAGDSQNQQAFTAITALPALLLLSAAEEDLLGYWEIELRKRLSGANKERFDLLPTHGSFNCQGPWINYDNAWVYTNHTLRATLPNSRLGTTVLMPHNGIFDLTFSITDKTPDAHSHFGLALDSRLGTPGEEQGPAFCMAYENGHWAALWCSRSGKESHACKVLSEVRNLSEPVTKTFLLSIRSDEDRVSASVDGTPLFENLALSSAFHDKFKSGRLPFLFGANITITRWTFTPF